MGKGIPINLGPTVDDASARVEHVETEHVEIDGALVARGLGLALGEFQKLMDHRKVTVLCERGVGEDAGLYRASFYHDGKRVRLVVDGSGNPV